MSSATVVTNLPNYLHTTYNYSKTFLRSNYYDLGTFENLNGDANSVYPIGTPVGRVAATGNIVPLRADAVDGSQYPIGILAQEVSGLATNGTQANVYFCIGGKVNGNNVVLENAPTDTLESVVDGRQLRDRIKGDTMGIEIVDVDELSEPDNQ